MKACTARWIKESRAAPCPSARRSGKVLPLNIIIVGSSVTASFYIELLDFPSVKWTIKELWERAPLVQVLIMQGLVKVEPDTVK